MHSPAKRLTRGLAGLCGAVLLAVFGSAGGAAQAAERAPVVVELYTSQGCSSCAPADQLLTELAMRPDVIALSLHVDYWDYIGWKDPFGSPMNTERQRSYATELGLRFIFTPQIVVDGRTSAVGSDRVAVEAAIAKAQARDRAVRISFRTDQGGMVSIGAGSAPAAGATVWLAVYDEDHDTEVKRGENAGRTIHNTNVVRSFERLGTWTGDALEIPLNLASAAVNGRYECAVIVQEGRNGPLLGAATMMLDTVSE